MQTIINLPDSNTRYSVESPSSTSTTVVIFLPGISGGVFSERFWSLVRTCHGKNLAVARVEIWKDAADVQSKTYAEIHNELLRIVDELKKYGFTKILGIGKSFGGAVMLTAPSPDIAKRVLWAPAIGFSESSGTFTTHLHHPLSTIASILDVTLDQQQLSAIAVPTLFIHGTKDMVVPHNNSQTLASMMPQASVLTIENADHSYNNPDHEKQVIEATVHFLS